MWFAGVLGFAAILGTAIIIWALRRGRGARDALQDYAEAQGWQTEFVPATHSSSGMTVISDPNDTWTLRVLPAGNGCRYEWVCSSGALDEGTAVLGPPLPPQAVKMMRSGNGMGKAVLKAGLKHTFGALGWTPRDLNVDEASANHPGGVVLASDGQARAMDALRDAAEVKMARVGKGEAEQPVIIRDTDGLRAHRVGPLRSMNELRDMVALGTALRTNFKTETADWL
ncbi:MAG: hypothetical protein HKN27_17180 [Silicimonas sp.]|nr:hypothetical protein [Silicimonas sp.]